MLSGPLWDDGVPRRLSMARQPAAPRIVVREQLPIDCQSSLPRRKFLEPSTTHRVANHTSGKRAGEHTEHEQAGSTGGSTRFRSATVPGCTAGTDVAAT